jgi:hypothetical protein
VSESQKIKSNSIKKKKKNQQARVAPAKNKKAIQTSEQAQSQATGTILTTSRLGAIRFDKPSFHSIRVH